MTCCDICGAPIRGWEAWSHVIRNQDDVCNARGEVVIPHMSELCEKCTVEVDGYICRRREEKKCGR